jgi:hypothetical protein
MTNRWDDLAALAKEIEHALSIGAAVDPDKARQLARLVLALEDEPARPEHTSSARMRAASS